MGQPLNFGYHGVADAAAIGASNGVYDITIRGLAGGYCGSETCELQFSQRFRLAGWASSDVKRDFFAMMVMVDTGNTMYKENPLCDNTVDPASHCQAFRQALRGVLGLCHSGKYNGA